MRFIVRILTVSVALSFAPVCASAQVSDKQLAERAAAKVRDYTPFSIFDDVSISADAGTVTLVGYVTMPYKRDELGARVGKLDGVRRLVNDLRVLPISQTDSDLRVRVAQAIYNNSAFWAYAAMPRPSIHIIVEGGRVTLTGSVNSEVDRSLAYALAQVPGAFEVKNNLRIDR